MTQDHGHVAAASEGSGGAKTKIEPPPHTGWPPGMLQDDCRELSRWLASRLGARWLVRSAADSPDGTAK